MSIKNLGAATAYGYAKAGGYTGTEAEFEALMASLPVDIDTIENLSVVATTLEPGSEATASYSDGVITLGIPRGNTGASVYSELAPTMHLSTVDPTASDGVDGDVWLVYTAGN